ncbi:MAG: hypothetical protein IJX37_01340 [Oscillospiraceae bacterium]|nr:hypothetical protein [Oscillospiraceae bacterium]
MNADMLHDAISLLPEELLAPVDALRQKKRAFWQPVAALAACVCLVAGLWLFLPGVSMDSSNGSAMEGFGDGSMGSIADQITQESGSTYSLSGTIIEVAEDYLIVQLNNTEPVTVLLDELEQIPVLSPGQKIRIYCEEIPDDTMPLVPYRIAIIEE